MSTPRSESVSFEHMEKVASALFANIMRPLRELWDGVRSKTLPWHACFVTGVLIQVGIFSGVDRMFFQFLDLMWLYPRTHGLFRIYYAVCILSPFWGWAVFKSLLKQKFLRQLTRAFHDIGLKNCTGRLPNFIFDRAIDIETRKLRLSRSGISPEEFLRKRTAIESALQIYIDEVREDRRKGTMDFIYGHSPMPSEYVSEAYRFRPNQFLIGKARSEIFFGDLDSTPHLLVAGQTGGGKSTFLRQFITSLYLGNPSHQFSLIDLKGGLEFQLFENLPRVKVLGSVKESLALFQRLVEEIEKRMCTLKEHHCKDIRQYNESPNQKQKLSRQVVIVDEAAEMFLAGHHAQAKEVQQARRTLSQIARQGRSLGIHLVIATQRPDSKSLDPQIKANLPGVLCFQMVNDASSIGVLGTGRATDLPPIPGRGIWKSSLESVEVQTPYLKSETAESLLKGFYQESDCQTDASKPTLNGSSDPYPRKQEAGD